MTPLPHRLPGAMFDALAAGGGGAEAMGMLARAEHSRRLACVYAVVTAAREAGGAAAEAAEEAWELLVAADRAEPGAVAAVLTHPSAGPALLGLLTRLTGGETPPGMTMHRLTALAAAAAVRARVPAQVRWPAPGPVLALPSLGRAHFPGARPGAPVELRVDTDGHARLAVPGSAPVRVPTTPYRPESPPDRWRAPYLLTTLRTGAPLLLDTLDPASFPSASDRPGELHADEVRAWASGARGACALLRADHPEVHAELAAGPRLIVPLIGTGRGNVSGSSAETFGCMAMSLPQNGSVFAATMAHELQHNKFAALLHLFDLFEADGEELFYAPWRPDPRPLLGLFHGAYAHLGVARFWGRRSETEPDPAQRAAAQTRFARWRSATHEATVVLLASGRLTPLGRRFAARMLESLDALCRVPLPPAALRHAEAASRAHRSAWNDSRGSAPPLPV
ncbi:HEXXH motif domain-containing protein [Streptomyces sp. QHH-9511]|uniref:aKG-HExxH-type peptide beta-hydroxylase n=1 Tax=Streptomyces sp. QHH-9511 TaxID=2684468 RepID=UPI001316C1B0|nr:HEXXH motif-containing putative peptide modification protein [Streptomyces sp. QHH-9511]QGZ51549.1 HEXXH motif domain-containing protein [Streptomyces sp. QHH-9511]